MSRIVVLSGGESTEHEVSLASGADVEASLRERHEVTAVRIGRDGRWEVSGRGGLSADEGLGSLHADDIVFPVLHGGWGEDGGLQSELDLRGIRYVGSGAAACRTGMSKIATARAAASTGVSPIPVRVLRRPAYLADPDLLVSGLVRGADLPLVVKPDNGGSSVGVSVVHTASQLRSALDLAFRLDGVVLLQPLVRGQEVSVGVWQDAAGEMKATGGSLLHLPTGEDAFTYEHKYEEAGGWLEIPAAFPEPTLDRLRADALRTARAIGVAGLARVDFFVVGDEVVLNEVNTLPGLRRTSHFPRLVAAAGTPYDELLDGLIERAAASETAAGAPSSAASPAALPASGRDAR